MDKAEKSLMVLAVGILIVGFIIVAVAVVVDSNYVGKTERDCSDRHGKLVRGGKYGDDFCISHDGRIVKVY